METPFNFTPTGYKGARASHNRFSPSLQFCRSVAGVSLTRNDPLFRSLEFLLTHYAGARFTSAGPYFIFRNGGPATEEKSIPFRPFSPFCPGTSGTIRRIAQLDPSRGIEKFVRPYELVAKYRFNDKLAFSFRSSR